MARRLGYRFVDLDEYIEGKLGRSIREVVEERGWQAFREEERRAMREFREHKDLVLSLGGGAVMHEPEMEALRDGGLVVWLSVPVETILERLSRDPKTYTQRPALTEKSLEEEVRELLSRREPLYARFADLELSSEALSPEEITRQILKTLKHFSST